MLELELARAARQGSALAIAVFDVDGMAAINDRLGHATGDDVLRTVAATIAGEVRLIDTVARLADDTFAVIAPGDVSGVAGRRVRDAVAALPLVGGAAVSVCAAVAHHPADGQTAAELLASALAGLERARATGPGTVVGAGGSA
jgi:diguanylate cyclase (GGDEF)-like protein